MGAAECEHHITLQESMDPANFNAARANYKRLMQCLQGMPGTPGTPLLQPGEASGPAASQPSMPAVSLPPPVTTAFGARVCSWPCTFTLYLNSCLTRAPVVCGRYRRPSGIEVARCECHVMLQDFSEEYVAEMEAKKKLYEEMIDTLNW